MAGEQQTIAFGHALNVGVTTTYPRTTWKLKPGEILSVRPVSATVSSAGFGTKVLNPTLDVALLDVLLTKWHCVQLEMNIPFARHRWEG